MGFFNDQPKKLISIPDYNRIDKVIKSKGNYLLVPRPWCNALNDPMSALVLGYLVNVAKVNAGADGWIRFTQNFCANGINLVQPLQDRILSSLVDQDLIQIQMRGQGGQGVRYVMIDEQKLLELYQHTSNRAA